MSGHRKPVVQSLVVDGSFLEWCLKLLRSFDFFLGVFFVLSRVLPYGDFVTALLFRACFCIAGELDDTYQPSARAAVAVAVKQHDRYWLVKSRVLEVKGVERVRVVCCGVSSNCPISNGVLTGSPAGDEVQWG